MAIKANLIIDQGTDYSTSITLTNDEGGVIDLAGYTANAQIRKTYSSSNSVAFAVTVAEASGILTLALTANQSANMTPGRFVYDVLIDSGTTKSRIVEGIVTLTPRVTQ